jgi:hypothetical protein
VTERAAPSAARWVRIVATFQPGATQDEFVIAVAAVGGRVLACETHGVTADVPGGAMGRLALVTGLAGIRAGESWDAPGRQAPDGPPEVRERLEQRERDARRDEADTPQDPQEN